MVEAGRFERPFAGPKPAVLPLDDASVVPRARIELARPKSRIFKTLVSTNFTIGARCPQQDSNLQPNRYERSALTVELYGRGVSFIIPSSRRSSASSLAQWRRRACAWWSRSGTSSMCVNTPPASAGGFSDKLCRNRLA